LQENFEWSAVLAEIIMKIKKELARKKIKTILSENHS
jgi:hypothetical protein